jgi:hypothetical protein
MTFSPRHPGESRGPVPRAAGLKRLDSSFRWNDGIRQGYLESHKSLAIAVNEPSDLLVRD